jgi:hypothetical protein
MTATARTLGRERLSSRLTPLLQIGPVALWLAISYVCVWVVLHRLPVLHGTGAVAVAPQLSRIVLMLLALPLLLLPFVAIWAGGLRSVATDGTSLLVTLATGRVAAVPLTSVVDVRERPRADLRTVRVTFDRKTRAGRSVRFLAPTRFTVLKGEAHPVVLALRDTVEAAQSATTVTNEAMAPLLLPRPDKVAASG